MHAALVDVTLLLCVGSLFLCVYIYIGYPMLLLILSRLRPMPVTKAPCWPSVSVIVPAFNEESIIAAKVDNTLATEYPHDRLEVLVASDGSTDRTNEIIEGLNDSRVKLLALPRKGKAFALNEAAGAASGEILAFTDATIMMNRSALAHLVEPFADPEVGAVTGSKRMLPPPGSDVTAQGEGIYWRYENKLKELESSIGSCYMGDGALHAIRRSLFSPITNPAQSDDMAISIPVVLKGHRLIFEPRAEVSEQAIPNVGAEFARKVRVTTHSMAALINLGSALWTSGFYSLELLSHKFFRHLVPFFLLLALITNAILVAHMPWTIIPLAVQITFYGLALSGLVLRRHPYGRYKIFSIPYYFCVVNAAAFVGVLSLLLQSPVERWTPRQAKER